MANNACNQYTGHIFARMWHSAVLRRRYARISIERQAGTCFAILRSSPFMHTHGSSAAARDGFSARRMNVRDCLAPQVSNSCFTWACQLPYIIRLGDKFHKVRDTVSNVYISDHTAAGLMRDISYRLET